LLTGQIQFRRFSVGQQVSTAWKSSLYCSRHSGVTGSREGFVLFAPLPEDHWITFVDLDPDALDIDQKDTPVPDRTYSPMSGLPA
jgi:hypothetical protein